MSDDYEERRSQAAWDDLNRAQRELDDHNAYGVAADFAASAAQTLTELAAVLATRRANEETPNV